MFDKTKQDIHRQAQKVKDTNQHYSKMGQRNAKNILRSRQDEHKDEYMRPSQYYEQYFKARRDALKGSSLGKKIIIIVIFLLVALVIMIGAFG